MGVPMNTIWGCAYRPEPLLEGLQKKAPNLGGLAPYWVWDYLWSLLYVLQSALWPQTKTILVERFRLPVETRSKLGRRTEGRGPSALSNFNEDGVQSWLLLATEVVESIPQPNIKHSKG